MMRLIIRRVIAVVDRFLMVTLEIHVILSFD